MKNLPIAIIVYALVLFSPTVLNDGDTLSHIAIGQWMLRTHEIPRADPFSFTAAGSPWIAHEWLSELAMAIAYQAGGLSGVLILTGAAVALLAALLMHHLRLSFSGPVSVAASPMRYLDLWFGPPAPLAILIFAFAAIAPSLLARPHILALPLLEVWTAGLLAARSRDERPSAWLLPVMVLWANLHGSFALGLALVVPFGLEAVMDSPVPRWRSVRDWGLFLACASAMALITPFGWHGLLFPFQLLGMTHLSDITEWRSIDFSTIQPLEVALMATLFVCLTRGVRIPPIRLMLLLGLLHMALAHTRHQTLIAVVGALVLADPLAHALDRRLEPDPGWRGSRTVITMGRFVFVGLIAVLTVTRLAYPVVPRDSLTQPVSALAHVPPELIGQPVFNDYAFGGLLIFSGVRPFIDGRADMYGDDFLGKYLDLGRSDRAALEASFRGYGIVWTILPPGSPVVNELDRWPGWKRVYADGFAVVHVRADATR